MKVKALLLSLFLLVGTTFSPKSEGVVAVTAGVVPGLVVLGAGTAYYGPRFLDGDDQGLFLGLIMFVSISIAVVALDDEGGVSFSEITQDGGRELGLSIEEVNAYNGELAEINAIADEVKFEVLKSESEEAGLESSKNMWTEMKNSFLSEDAASALTAIANAATE